MANSDRNVASAPPNPPGSAGCANASWVAVTTYVDRSARNAATNTAGSSPPPSLRVRTYPPHATHGPTMPMEKTFAPSVVMPPWASSRAWKSRTMEANTAITGGRNSTVPRPVPVGCDVEPVTDGIFRADSTNVNAPAAPRSRPVPGFSLSSVLTRHAPWTTNGAAATVHPTAWPTGRKPSAICMLNFPHAPPTPRGWRTVPPDAARRRGDPRPVSWLTGQPHRRRRRGVRSGAFPHRPRPFHRPRGDPVACAGPGSPRSQWRGPPPICRAFPSTEDQGLS